MSHQEFIQKTNYYSNLNIPFLFVVDFEQEKPFVCELSQAKELGFFYSVNGNSNMSDTFPEGTSSFKMQIDPVNLMQYSTAFNTVKQNIIDGNSYLLNLTFPSKIQLSLSFEDIFKNAEAPYKLLHKDFVVFSPECFIKIIGGEIYSYPMKGTIDASIPEARKIILEDEKELWEHNTIVDLIRNDLSIVSTNVKVSKFRYITTIRTHKNTLLQVNSEIKGQLPKDWKSNIGNILLKLLPAGSISGAPKQKTFEIIKEAEGVKRGYYTGVFGIFDGNNLDSGVMIRYMEKTTDGCQFRSGGGITAMSKENKEYNELINKVYVPFV